MKDRILEIIQDNYNKFTGTNEAELHAAEEIEKIIKYWKARCKFAEKYLSSIPIDNEEWGNSSAPFHKNEYQIFIKNNPEP